MFRLIFYILSDILCRESGYIWKETRKAWLWFYNDKYLHLFTVSAFIYLFLSLTIGNHSWFHWSTSCLIKFYCVYAMCSWPFLIKSMYLRYKIWKVNYFMRRKGYPKKRYRARKKHNWPKIHYQQFYQIKNSRYVRSK